MAKNNRGKSLYKLPTKARGTCPVCLATRIKLLYTVKKADGIQLQVCKRCSKASTERIEAAIVPTAPLAYRRKHKAAFHRYGAKQPPVAF
ncbi:hypothetical protein J40TS1_10160 [Paenibacillus montaniterrae]|uniref:Uncharacterized protein n=1 Tax=Paenibacillus montaniterrae TaxID=429341 RepID=A0A919YNK1_9BACL|nr:hypothetical protein [Paenibacillus montaniterrae]GIP15374.1 hypothetical protein J40TS1_10160 [Paenibacillus montaniterrae]